MHGLKEKDSLFFYSYLFINTRRLQTRQQRSIAKKYKSTKVEYQCSVNTYLLPLSILTTKVQTVQKQANNLKV
ncbi:unnamed protein product [Mucor hiemalis]